MAIYRRDCDQATILDTITNNINAAGGDSIQCNDGSWTWSSDATWTKPFTLTATTPCALDGNSRATSTCGTTITITTDLVAQWNFTFGKAHRITGLKFVGNGSAVSGSSGLFYINGNNKDVGGGVTSTFRFDHNYVSFNATEAPLRILWMDAAIGVVDHNYMRNDGNGIFYYEARNWYGTSNEPPDPVNGGRYGDESRYYPLVYPSAQYFQSMFVENNELHGADKVSDGVAGGRIVFRFNDLYRAQPKMHGLDSGGRDRATRHTEVYKNNFDNTGGSQQYFGENRDGNMWLWGNVGTGFGGSPVLALVSNYRENEPTFWWGAADGTSRWDVNDGGNPYGSFTASSGGTNTVTVTGAGWNPANGGQWKNYIIRKISATGGCPEDYLNVQACHAVVLSNTADTITFDSPPGGSNAITFAGGDQFTLNKITHAMDQPGRTDAILLNPHYGVGYSTVSGYGWEDLTGNVARFCTDTTEDDLSDIIAGDYITAESGDANHYYSGVYQVVSMVSSCVAGAGHGLTISRTSGGPSTGVSGSVTLVPATVANFQTTTPNYQWLNTANGSNVAWSVTNGSPLVMRQNVHYYDYVPSGFDGTVGVGSGTAAAMAAITTCTEGVAYWVTDEGAWCTGCADQGRLYICGLSNNWVLSYTPYDYPHPLTLGDQAASSTVVHRAMLQM